MSATPISVVAEPTQGLALLRSSADAAVLRAAEETKPVIATAEAIVVSDDSSFEYAGAFLKDVKTREKAWDEFFEPMLRDAVDTHKGILARKKEVREPLEKAEGIVKTKVVRYNQEQAEKAARLQREQEAIARKAEEDRRLADAAAAVEAGIPEEAVMETFNAPIVPMSVAPAPPPPKVQGLSFATAYRAEVTGLLELVKFVAANPSHLNLLLANMTALNSMAKAQKEGLALPGVRVVKEQISRVGSR
jgi:gas vesicle protein